MAHAIKGACGRNGESEGLQVFMQWASKWEGPVDQAEDERVFASIGWQNVRSGWPELWRLAENYGYDASAEHGAEAQAVFATVPIPAGTPAIVTPVATASLDLHDKLIELRERLAVISDPLLREATRDARLARLSQTFHVPFGVLQKLLDAFDAPHRQVPVQIIRPGPALRDALSQAPPLALVPGYLFADMQHVLYGTPQSLKTFTALDFALHIASGKPWLGSIPVAQRGVVFFAGEAASSLRVRIAAWCAARSVSVEEAAALPFALIDAVPTLGHGDDGLRHAIDRVQEAATEFSVPVGLLVLDNMTRLAAVAGLSTTDTGEYGRILAGIDALGRATKASTLTIYHSPVSDPSRPAGTYQSTANPDVIMKAEREANAPRTLIRVVKTRNASPPPDLPLEFKVQDVRDWLAASYRQEGLPFPETLNTAAEVFGADNQSPNNAGDLATAARESLLQQFTSLVVDSRGAAQASSLAGPNEDNQLEERVLAVLERHPEASQKTLRAALRGTRDTNIDGAVFNLIQDGFVEDRRKGSAHAYQLTTTGSARVVAARKPDYAALAEFEQNAAGAPQGDD